MKQFITTYDYGVGSHSAILVENPGQPSFLYDPADKWPTDSQNSKIILKYAKRPPSSIHHKPLSLFINLPIRKILIFLVAAVLDITILRLVDG